MLAAGLASHRLLWGSTSVPHTATMSPLLSVSPSPVTSLGLMHCPVPWALMKEEREEAEGSGMGWEMAFR